MSGQEPPPAQTGGLELAKNPLFEQLLGSSALFFIWHPLSTWGVPQRYPGIMDPSREFLIRGTWSIWSRWLVGGWGFLVSHYIHIPWVLQLRIEGLFSPLKDALVPGAGWPYRMLLAHLSCAGIIWPGMGMSQWRRWSGFVKRRCPV